MISRAELWPARPSPRRRVGAGTAHVQPLQGAAIVAVAQHRTGREQLIQAQRAVKNIAADQAEGTLEIERAHDLAAQHGCLEIRRMAVDEIDHDVRDFVAMRVPRCPIRKHGSHVLAEQTGHMLSRGARLSSRVEGINISTMGRFDHPQALASR